MTCPTCRFLVERPRSTGAALSVPCPDCGRFGDERDASLDTTDCTCVFPQRPAVQHRWCCQVRQRFEHARFAGQLPVGSLVTDGAVRTLVSCEHPASERVTLGRHRDGQREIGFCDVCGTVPEAASTQAPAVSTSDAESREPPPPSPPKKR